MYIFIHINIQYILYMCTVYCMHLHENQDVPVFTQRGCAPSTKTKPQMFIQWGSLASTRLSVCVLTSVCLILFHSPYSAFSHLLSFPFLPFFFFVSSLLSFVCFVSHCLSVHPSLCSHRVFPWILNLQWASRFPDFPQYIYFLTSSNSIRLGLYK